MCKANTEHKLAYRIKKCKMQHQIKISWFLPCTMISVYHFQFSLIWSQSLPLCKSLVIKVVLLVYCYFLHKIVSTSAHQAYECVDCTSEPLRKSTRWHY